MPPSRDLSTRFNPVILAPTFNNAQTLASVLNSLTQLKIPVIVVDDGSTDATAAILKSFPNFTLRSHDRNLGKAAALRTGFEAAAKMGFTHALTIDTDSQHDPADIPALLEFAAHMPTALILGRRQAKLLGCPAKNRLGRAISNSLVFLESGLIVQDSQCGLRVYPLELISRTNCSASRYGYETEILTRCAWQNTPVIEHDVACHYSTSHRQPTHFRPFADTFRSAAMHARLLTQSIPHWPRRLMRAFHPVATWRHLRQTPQARHNFAGGLALGVFFACIPIYGAQGILSLLAARICRVSRLSALAGAQLSTPPINAVLLAASLFAGHLLLHQTLPDTAVLHIGALRTILIDLTVGGILIGAALSLLTYFTVRATLAIARDPQ